MNTDMPRSEQDRIAGLRRDGRPTGAAAVPAATVVLIRDGRDGLEVLLARRSSQLAFHGGAWVFGQKTGQAYPLLGHLAERGWIGVRVRQVAEIHREHPGRRWAGVLVPAHNDAILRQRHSSLFEHRRSNWRRSRAPWRSKLILPVIGRLGMVSQMNKQRLYQLVHDPGRLLQVRLRRVRQRLRRSV